MHKKLICIVIPLYNEAANIPPLYAALEAVRPVAAQVSLNYIFINDGSTDNSNAIATALCAQNPDCKYVEFSRNFGKEMATTAGIRAAADLGADAVIMLDADLQHPPTLIPEFIRRWEAGAEVVVGVRTGNTGEGFIKRVGSKAYHRLMKLISTTKSTSGETDFRLIDRCVVEAFLQLGEQKRMTRSLINWLGFTRAEVPFEAPPRLHGPARYTLRKLIHLAVFSFVSDSLLPLRLAGYFGMSITLLSLVVGITILIEKYGMHDPFSWGITGTAQLAVVNTFLVGIVLMALGLIALYIENIHTEVAHRPLYIIRKRTNL